MPGATQLGKQPKNCLGATVRTVLLRDNTLSIELECTNKKAWAWGRTGVMSPIFASVHSSSGRNPPVRRLLQPRGTRGGEALPVSCPTELGASS